MLKPIARHLFRAFFRDPERFSIAQRSSTFSPEYKNDDLNSHCIEENEDFSTIRRDDVKSLKVAIIGLPNVGKSTLINCLMKRQVCATADRFHVTREKSDAVYSENDTQLIFIDTPGLVSRHEFKKFELEESFRKDAGEAMVCADIVGVVQDITNKYTRGVIHDNILELVKMSRVGVPSLLIMNKIDMMKKKRDLLSLVKSLTSEKGWPNFSDVFMVSSSTGDGIDDLRNYLLDSAKPRDWEYSADVITDQPIERMIERAVRAKFMDCLPNELPYRLKIQLEHLDKSEDGSINCVVTAGCESERISKLVLGKGGRRVKTVALQAEQELSNAFRNSFRLKIAVQFPKMS